MNRNWSTQNCSFVRFFFFTFMQCLCWNFAASVVHLLCRLCYAVLKLGAVAPWGANRWR